MLLFKLLFSTLPEERLKHHIVYVGENVPRNTKMRNFEGFMGRFEVKIVDLDKVPDPQERMV